MKIEITDNWDGSVSFNCLPTAKERAAFEVASRMRGFENVEDYLRYLILKDVVDDLPPEERRELEQEL